MPNKQQVSQGEDEVLEALVRIEHGLDEAVEAPSHAATSDNYYEFDSWTACTCGHIYLHTGEPEGTTIRELTERQDAYTASPQTDRDHPDNLVTRITRVSDTDGLYERVMDAVIEANGIEVPDDGLPLGGIRKSHAVSTATADLCHNEEPLEPLEAALLMVRRTITSIKQRQLEAAKRIARGDA